MKKFIFVLLLCGIACSYLSLQYHFILFEDSLRILKKSELRTKNTFVDARGAKVMKIAVQPDLIEAGIKEAIGKQKGFSISIPVVK